VIKSGAKKRAREPVVIYADGACLGNPGPAGCGVLLAFRGREKRVSKYLGIGTNNIAELEAVRLALGLLKNRKTPVDLHTDSSYAIGVLTKPWKPKANLELIAKVKAMLALFSDVRVIKVAGHAGVRGNEVVDELARQAAATGLDLVEEQQGSARKPPPG